MIWAMASPLSEPTTALEKRDRVGDLPHRPRVLLAKMGLDGHDRGVKLIARALRDIGQIAIQGLATAQDVAAEARRLDCSHYWRDGAVVAVDH